MSAEPCVASQELKKMPKTLKNLSKDTRVEWKIIRVLSINEKASLEASKSINLCKI